MIKETLQVLTPPPHSIHISIHSQSVTICHPTTLSYPAIIEAIDEAGFDIVDPTIADPVQPSSTSKFCTLPRHAKKHLEQCHAC
jgi:P-type Cu+ transporter